MPLFTSRHPTSAVESSWMQRSVLKKKKTMLLPVLRLSSLGSPMLKTTSVQRTTVSSARSFSSRFAHFVCASRFSHRQNIDRAGAHDEQRIGRRLRRRGWTPHPRHARSRIAHDCDARAGPPQRGRSGRLHCPLRPNGSGRASPRARCVRGAVCARQRRQRRALRAGAPPRNVCRTPCALRAPRHGRPWFRGGRVPYFGRCCCCCFGAGDSNRSGRRGRTSDGVRVRLRHRNGDAGAVPAGDIRVDAPHQRQPPQRQLGVVSEHVSARRGSAGVSADAAASDGDDRSNGRADRQ